MAPLPRPARTPFCWPRRTSLATQIAASFADKEDELKTWSQTLKQNCEEHLGELRLLAPWLAAKSEIRNPKSEINRGLLAPAAKLEEKLAALDQALTLRELSMLDQSLDPLIEGGVDRDEFSRCLREAGDHARQRLLTLESLATQSDELAT